MSSTSNPTSSRVPVVVVGAGPVGLLLSCLLSTNHIPHIVFERHMNTSIHPKACGITQRTMEIFRYIGIEDEIYTRRAPPNTVSHTAWYTSLRTDRTELCTKDVAGGGARRLEYTAASPCQYSVLPQIRLEPVLKRRAEELNPGCIRWGHKVLNCEERDGEVIVPVTSTEWPEEQISAQYVLGADGGRTLMQSLGFTWEGLVDVAEMITAHIKADITSVHPDRRVFISWLFNPKLEGGLELSSLYHLGPYSPVREAKEEWAFGFQTPDAGHQQVSKEEVIRKVRESTGFPNLDVEVLSISPWMVNARVASQYRSSKGRIFLVGDANKRVPPFGAQGLNTGIQDAFNLVWKLRFALRSDLNIDYSPLLDTYESERKEIARFVADTCMENMLRTLNSVSSAAGLLPDASLEENLAALKRFNDSTHPDYDDMHHEVALASKERDTEFQAHGMEMGWFYPDLAASEGGDSHHGGQLYEDGAFNVTHYYPSTIPGHNVPHVWLKKQNEVISSRDLVRPGRFTLLTCRRSGWDKAVAEIQDFVDLVVIDDDKEWSDVDGTWKKLSGVDVDGAVLMRPDGVVAWRARVWEPQYSDQLGELLYNVLKFGAANPSSRHSDETSNQSENPILGKL